MSQVRRVSLPQTDRRHGTEAIAGSPSGEAGKRGTDYGHHDVLGVRIRAIDYVAAVDLILESAKKRESMLVAALAVHGVMTGVLDPNHRYRLNQFPMLVPDGQPVRWALKLLHRVPLRDRVYGPELMLRICAAAETEGLSIFLYGSTPQVLEPLCRNLKDRFPRLDIAGARPSAFRQLTGDERDEMARAIASSGAEITFVGLGCPRQEVWAFEHRDLLQMPLVAVGAAFDFHAGMLPQAPASWQRLGLEWLFRLITEPRRLWRRYLLLNPSFLVLLAAQASGLDRIAKRPAQPPSSEIRYG